MTYNPSVPLSTDSPSIFPAQGQANFTRLKTLLGADHQFNNSVAANDGYHNLIHMTQQAPSGTLAATGRLYAKSTAGLIQLFYMDDAGTEYQVTPDYADSPQKITGTDSLASMATMTILSVSYDYQGWASCMASPLASVRTYSMARISSLTSIVSVTGSSPAITLAFSGTDLQITNNSLITQTVVWSLMVNRLT